jgi:hypothetical protein
MDKKQNNSESSRPAASVQEIGLVLQPGGSKKLAELRRKAQTNPPPPVDAAHTSHEIPADLKAEVAAELKKARRLIDEKIADIMSRFPAGKQNKLFSFRYGSVDAIKRMDLNDAFKRLGIAHNQVNMRLIAGLDYYGDAAGNRGNQVNPSETAE